jgi:hypothetical protein
MQPSRDGQSRNIFRRNIFIRQHRRHESTGGSRSRLVDDRVATEWTEIDRDGILVKDETGFIGDLFDERVIYIAVERPKQ